MSHFATVTTQIKSKEDVIACLKKLGYTILEKTQVKGYTGNVHVDFAVASPGGGYEIGFRLNKGSYEICADWWGVRGLTEKQFRSSLLVEYADLKTRRYAKRKGFTLKEEKVAEGRQLVLTNRIY